MSKKMSHRSATSPGGRAVGSSLGAALGLAVSFGVGSAVGSGRAVGTAAATAVARAGGTVASPVGSPGCAAASRAAATTMPTTPSTASRPVEGRSRRMRGIENSGRSFTARRRGAPGAARGAGKARLGSASPGGVATTLVGLATSAALTMGSSAAAIAIPFG